MVRVLEEDFASGIIDTAKWSRQGVSTGCSVTIAPVQGQTLNNALVAACDGTVINGGQMAYIQHNLANSMSDIYVRLYAMFDKIAAKSYIPLNIRNHEASGGGLAWLIVYPTHVSLLYNDATGSNRTVSTSLSLVPNRYYCIEIHVAVGAGSGQVQLFVDGVNVAEALNINNLTTPYGQNFTGDSVKRTFNLYAPLIINSEVITVNGLPETRNIDYTIDYDTGIITFVVAPATGATIRADYVVQNGPAAIVQVGERWYDSGTTDLLTPLAHAAYIDDIVAADAYVGPISTVTPLSISISPSSATLSAGQHQLLTAAISGGTAPITLAWKDSAENVLGTNTTYDFVQNTAGTYLVHCEATDVDGTVVSNIATIVVNPATVPPSRVEFEAYGLNTVGELRIDVNGTEIYSNPAIGDVWTALTVDIGSNLVQGKNVLVIRNPGGAYNRVRNVKIIVNDVTVVDAPTEFINQNTSTEFSWGGAPPQATLGLVILGVVALGAVLLSK